MATARRTSTGQHDPQAGPPQDRAPRSRAPSRHTEEALRESEDRYRRLVELSPDAIIVHKQGVIEFANAATARLVGAQSPADLLGRSILQFVHPDSRPLVLTRLQRLRMGVNVSLVEERFIRLDGSAIDVEVAATPFTHEGTQAVQVVARDITDRRGAEASLRRQKEYLEALHETSLALMNRLDLKESLEAIVARAGALVGTPHGYMYRVLPGGEEIEATVVLGAFRDFRGYRMKRGEGMAGKVWDTGEPLLVEDYDSWPGRSPGFATGVFRAVVGLPLKSGTDVVGIIGLAHVEEGKDFDEEQIAMLGQFGGLASIALDNARLYTDAQRELSERTAAEEALRQSEEKYRTLVEQIPAITYTAEFGDQGTWRYVSPQIEAIMGFTQEEWTAQGNLWLRQLHPEDSARVRAEEKRSQRTGKPVTSEYRLLARDGRIVWVRDEAVVVPGSEGTPLLQGILFDVTERKRAEEERERALMMEREAGERLRALDEMKNTFLHAVSHELRTPLSAVLGFALTLEREDVEFTQQERHELVRRLASNARKLDQLLSDLLDLDRLDRGIVEPRRRPTDVAALVRRTVENSDVLGMRPVRIEAELVVVAVDAPKVERIVENLLANAIRHTPPDTTIWVRVTPDPGGVLIQVDDSGPGVPQEMRESIFEPFRQGPIERTHSPGVGIGLSLVARFAELHGGRAWVQEGPGGGASFRVFLPGGPLEGGQQLDYFSTGTPTREPYSVHEPS
jgi:PAS domain S-box-containing protein